MFALPPLGRRPPYTEVTLNLTGAVAPLSGPLHLAGWVFAPPEVSAYPVVLICLPGAGFTKAYYHLEVSSEARGEYSLALALSRRGCVVICLDPLGVGASSTPPGTLLSLETMALANAVATHQIRQRLKTATLCPGLPPMAHVPLIGVGHSAGAWLLLRQQATHRSFAALALLGSTNGPHSFPEAIGLVGDPLVRADPHGYVRLERQALPPFWSIGVPEVVLAELDRLAAPLPVGLLGDLQQPGFIREDAAQIEVPVLLVTAEYDRSTNVVGEVEAYPAVRDLTLVRLTNRGSCHLFGPARKQVWQRLALWCQIQGSPHRRESVLSLWPRWVSFRVWQHEMRQRERRFRERFAH